MCLYLNSQEVSRNQIGQIVEDFENQTIELTYYNLELEYGENILTLKNKEDYNKPKDDILDEIVIYRTGEPANIKQLSTGWFIEKEKDQIFRIPLLITDSEGLPVRDGVTGKVFIKGGTVLNGQKGNGQDFVKVKVDEGKLMIDVQPEKLYEKPVEIRFIVGNLEKNISIPVQKEVQSPIFAGSGNFTLGLSPQINLNFYGSTFIDYPGDIDLRARLNTPDPYQNQNYVDNQKNILTGDKSEIKNMSPSSDLLYFMINNQKGSLLYGDFKAGWPGKNEFLNYEKNVTGFMLDYNDQFSAFYFNDKLSEHKERIPARGLSVFYYLNNFPIIPGSEEIYLCVVKELDNGDEIEISRKLQEANKDYFLNYNTGTLQFSSPVSGIDPDLNSVIIEISYSVEGNNSQTSGYGLRKKIIDKPHHNLSISWLGGDAINNNGLIGLDGEVNFKDPFVLDLEYEIAQMLHHNSLAAGIDLKAKPDEKLSLAFTAKMVEDGYMVPGKFNYSTPGINMETSLGFQLDDESYINYRKNMDWRETAINKYSDLLSLRINRKENLTEEIGFKSTGNSINPFAPQNKKSLFMSGKEKITPKSNLSIYQEYPLNISEKNMINEIKYTNEITDQSTFFVSYRDKFAKDYHPDKRWTFGFEAKPLDGTKIYGQYKPSFSKGENESRIIGLRNNWQILPQLNISLSGEHKSNIDLTNKKKITQSGVASINYELFPLMNTSLDFEYFKSNGNHNHKTTLGINGENLESGIAYYLDSTWYNIDQRSNDKKLINEIRGAIAYRETDINRHNLLANFINKKFKNPSTQGLEAHSTEMTVANFDWGYQINDQYQLLTKFAGKQTLDLIESELNDLTVNKSAVYLGQAGINFKINDDYNLKTFGRKLWDSEGNQHAGVAAEVTYSLTDNIGFGIGYSTLGNDDPDLKSVIDWPEGAYLKMDFKF